MSIGRATTARVRGGVVHLGLGGFHRSHEAFVFHQLLQAGHLGWGVTGVCMRSPEVRDQMAPQDGLYTVLVRGREATQAIVCGAITRVLLAAEGAGCGGRGDRRPRPWRW